MEDPTWALADRRTQTGPKQSAILCMINASASKCGNALVAFRVWLPNLRLGRDRTRSSHP